jgi:segregation and condensation protein B
MSLKAKLEAVIYAAEEPVTLTQLAALFAGDALEWKAAQQAAAEQAAAAAAEERTDPQGLLGEGLDYLGLADSPEVYATEVSEATTSDIPSENEPASPDAGPAAASPTVASAPESPEAMSPEAEGAQADGEDVEADVPPADAEADAKRQARVRDRDVKSALKQILDELTTEYAADSRGVEIREIAGGYRMATKPEFHDAVRSFVKSLKPAMKLSLPALETLAVIAYKQPVTAPEVNEIRGVDSSGVFGSLLARKLIVTAGRKPVVGRPILYKTTREFLLRFGLKDVSELPSMEEFEKIAASEFEAAEATEETAANEPEEFNPDPSLERDEAEAVAPEAESSRDGSVDAAAPPNSTE